MTTGLYDCIIVGGGVAGLTAGIYLSRFKCKICIIDNNESRAVLITRSHNFPAFPAGISGKKILERLRKQYDNYHGKIITDKVSRIIKKKSFFVVKARRTSLKTQFVILATGVVDIEPAIPNLRTAIKDGLIRHCLICDAYEAAGKKIIIIADKKSCIKQALFLRCYTQNLTVITIGNLKFTRKENQKFKENNIKVVDGQNCKFIIKNKKIKSIQTEKGKWYIKN